MAVIGCLSVTGNAQNLLSNVPSNASVVVKYSGENFSGNVPVKKLDAYNFVKNNFFKALKIDSLTSLDNTGIDLQKDAYQYLVADDSSFNFVSLLHLKNIQQFLQLVQANYQAEMKPEKKNGFEFLSMSRDTYLGWNSQQAVLVYSSYRNKKNYYDYPMVDTAVVMVDSTVSVESENFEAPPPPPPPPPAVKKPKGKKTLPGKKKPVPVKPHKKGTTKKPAPKKPVEEPAEIVIDAYPEDGAVSYEDSVATAKREAWYQEQEKYAVAKQSATADSIINSVFNSKVASIETEGSYKKIIDPAAHVSIWLNYDNLVNQYWATMFKSFSRITHTGFISKPVTQNTDNGFKSAVNIFFEKDKMRMDQKMYSPDEQLAALGREIYNSKQSNSLAGFISPGNIATMSASINTEAMANYYYKLIRQYLNNTPFVNQYSDIVDVYMDFIEIIIDEKAIAELMPGNMVMVLHDMKTKMVSYTDYVYDENDFTTKEVKKTRQELSPNFTFVMETKKQAFMQKLANLPVKYAEKEKFNYKEKGGYYELAFDADKYPISGLYFMVKDGKGIITTSKEVIDMTLANKGYNLDGDTKKMVLNNNVYVNINSKKLIQQINPELSTELSKKISAYLEENMGDVQITGGIKDGIMQGTTTMNITGNHANSLEFFFNMIDAINNIMEADKAEREKKID